MEPPRIDREDVAVFSVVLLIMNSGLKLVRIECFNLNDLLSFKEKRRDPEAVENAETGRIRHSVKSVVGFIVIELGIGGFKNWRNGVEEARRSGETNDQFYTFTIDSLSF